MRAIAVVLTVVGLVVVAYAAAYVAAVDNRGIGLAFDGDRGFCAPRYWGVDPNISVERWGRCDEDPWAWFFRPMNRVDRIVRRQYWSGN